MLPSHACGESSPSGDGEKPRHYATKLRFCPFYYPFSEKEPTRFEVEAYYTIDRQYKAASSAQYPKKPTRV
jgi:hypothetical protein